MAITTEISWGDGSGDKIYVTREASEGNQIVSVSSDANTGAARSKVVSFTSGVGSIVQQLTITQAENLPYTPVEYIETDGVAFITTNVAGNAPKSFTGKMLPICPSTSTGSSYFLGCRKDSGNTRFWAFSVYGTKTAAFGYYSGYYANVDISDSIDNETPLEFHSVLQRGTCRVGVKQQGESSFTDYSISRNYIVTTNYYITLFGVNNAGTIAHSLSGTRCYGLKIYNSGNYTNLVFDAIPCYYQGEYGMWDKVSNAFFGNRAGAGAFTGPAIN